MLTFKPGVSLMVQFHGENGTSGLSNGHLPNGIHKPSPAGNGSAQQPKATLENGPSEREQNGWHASTSNRHEPLLADNDDRFTFFPIKYDSLG